MGNFSRVFARLPIEAQISLLCINARTFLVIQLVRESSDAEDVDWRLWEIENIVDEELVSFTIIVTPCPFDGADSRRWMIFAADCRNFRIVSITYLTNKH